MKEVGHLPTSNTRGVFPQQSVCERDSEFAASHAVDTEIPGLERKSDFLADFTTLNPGSSFISKDKGMSEPSVQSLEKALGPSLIWTGSLTSFDTSRGQRINASKGAEA